MISPVEVSTFILKNNKKNANNDESFIQLLKCKWDNLHTEHGETNVFRYTINNLQERLVDSVYFLQLNPDRAEKRRAPEQINDVCQAFDENKFNFTKINKKEILFYLKCDKTEDDFHALLVNSSPIEKYHSLLCPSINKKLPQIITEDSLKLVLEIACQTQERDLRIGFNSLCALASVNHLHYHLFLQKHSLPVEKEACTHLKGPLYCLNKNYPATCFCFELSAIEFINETAFNIFKLIDVLLKKSIAHNVMITRGSTLSGTNKEVLRVLVFLRKSSSGVKVMTAFNVALLELSGWFPVYCPKDFKELTNMKLEQELLKWKISNFQDICEEMKTLY